MSRVLPWLSTLVFVAACSRPPDLPTAPPAAKPRAQVASTADEAHVQVPAELLAHLERPDSPVLGPAKAPVTVVEFLDPACSACRAYAPVVRQIQFLYPREVRLVVRFADFHPGSEDAIRIVLAAHRQGKLEAVLSALFDEQDTWAANHSPNAAAAWKVAGAAGLDLTRARKDADSAGITERLSQETEDILALQVSSTPTFYVNGKLLVTSGAEPLLQFVTSEVKAAAVTPASR